MLLTHGAETDHEHATGVGAFSVWRQHDQGWQEVARHANIVSTTPAPAPARSGG